MQIFQGSVYMNFFGQNGQQFKIPVYQRNYEWSIEQCNKLFEDIVQASKRNQLHFCGSIVFQPISQNKGINNSIIIDGQQRLTTIYILMKALLDMAQDDAERMTPTQALFNYDPFNQFQLDETSKLKLKPAKDNNDQLLALLYDKKEDLDCNSEIYQNYLHFCELIKKEQDKGTTVNDITRGIGLLTVASIRLDDNDKAQEIFERINSTGIPLNLSDKIRNYVLMTDENQEELYENYWLKIEKLLAKDQINAFFMDYINMKQEGFTKESTAYDDFKAIYSKEGHSNESILKDIHHYVEQYHLFLNHSDDLSPEINKALYGLRALKQTTVYLFLFHVFDDYQNEIIDAIVLEKVLKLLLNYSIRRMICEIGSNSLRGLYKTLYGRVFINPENKKHYYDSIVSFLQQLTSKDCIPRDLDFVMALKERNLYRKNALCKYLLSEIENQGKEKVVTENLTIEHIMPQNKDLSIAWQKMLGDDWAETRDRYLHTLGNLTLTGYNTELGDKPFLEKKALLEEKGTHITILYSDVEDKDYWNENAIKNRAERLSKLIMDLFKIEGPTEEIEFNDPRYQRYSVEDPHEATYKVVNYYELLGERVNVDSFALMVRSVARKLYDLDSKPIENMARNNEKFPGWINQAFSFDEKLVKNPVRLLENQNIFISTGYSAYDCIVFIRALLKLYDLDIAEDFYYNARVSKMINRDLSEK